MTNQQYRWLKTWLLPILEKNEKVPEYLWKLYSITFNSNGTITPIFHPSEPSIIRRDEEKIKEAITETIDED